MSDKTQTPEEELLFQVADGIGIITLNRPHRRNALTFAMYDRIKEICMRAGGSDDADKLRVLIFKGGGDAAFAAGTEISQRRQPRRLCRWHRHIAIQNLFAPRRCD